MTNLLHIRPNCLILVFCTLFAGCLPTSCRRAEPQAISSADSLSRAIAEDILPDTLRSPLILHGTHLGHPRTVLFGQNDHIYASDTKNGYIYIFTSDGKVKASFTLPDTNHPYLAGWRSDSLIVFDPKARRFHFVIDTMSVASFITVEVPENSLQYALATKTGFYLKAVTNDTTHFLWSFDQTGIPMHESILYGSSWKHAGLLRHFNNRLVSLSGFYPWALTWEEDVSGAPDTLRWLGFDSPMLRRTYAFDLGYGRGAPLITSSATPAGEFWFVLNQRAGWLRVDIYDSTGMLRHILVEDNPGYIRDFYPIDLAAQLNSDGTYQLSVALVAPEPLVRVYKWIPPTQT